MTFEDLDPYAILQTLGLSEATAITPVHGGSDTGIWQVERGSKVYALRVFRRGQQAGYEREKVVMEAARSSGLPVPKVHATGIWHDHPALLLSWLPGRPVAGELRARPWRAWLLGVAFGRMQALIHAVPAPGILRQQPDAWIKWSGSEEGSLQERLLATGRQKSALLHLDYHPLNVLTDGRNITGVLDWRNALAGDPRADAARMVSILRVDIVNHGRPRILEVAVRRVFEQGWRIGYEQKRKRLGDLSLFYAWAGAVMERDLAAKRAPEDLARIHGWTMRWKKQAGLLYPFKC